MKSKSSNFVKTLLLFSILSKAIAVIPEAPGPIGEPDFAKPFVKDHIEVAFNRHANKAIPDQVAHDYGCKILKQIGKLNIYLFSLPKNLNVRDTYQRLKGDSRIKWAWPDYELQLHYAILGPPPNDPNYTNGISQWNVAKMQADLMWNTPAMMPWAKGLTTTIIAVVDTGVYSLHEDLQAKMLSGWNVLNSTTDVTDNVDHGTNVASAAASAVNNSKGIAGLAWNCMILPIKVSNSPTFSDSNAASGVDWARSHGASVINCSFGGPSIGATETAIFDAYYFQGIVTVSGPPDSAVNLNSSPDYPSSLPYVISVSGSDSGDNWAGFGYGSILKCVAPVPVYVADTCGLSCYATWSGTSLATPQVAALTALLISNGVPYYECVSRVAYTAEKVGPNSAQYLYSPAPPDPHAFNPYFGYGRINFYRAMETLVPPTLNTSTAGVAQVSLAWSAPSLALWPTSGYNIYRATSTGGPYTQVASLGNVLGYTDSSLTGGSTYYYVVKAVDGTIGFETKTSNELSAIPLVPSPTTSPTPSITATFTFSPTITQSFTYSPTSTWSPTASPSPTITPTFSATNPVPTPQPGRTGYVYPQPASGSKLTLVYTLDQAGPVTAYIYNQAGNLVGKDRADGQARPDNLLEIDIEGWGWGVYYLILESGGNRKSPIRFVVGK